MLALTFFYCFIAFNSNRNSSLLIPSNENFSLFPLHFYWSYIDFKEISNLKGLVALKSIALLLYFHQLLLLCLKLVSTKLTRCLTKQLYPFTLLLAETEDCQHFMSMPAFCVVSDLEFGHSNRYIMIPHCSNLHFLITYAVELWPFSCLHAICVVSLGMHLLRLLVHYLNWFIFYC